MTTGVTTDLAPAAWPASLDPEAPYLVGRAPAAFSTAADLVVDPQVCYDVNGYYADLGVHWRASRVELYRAYLAREGWTCPRLTYVLDQLLDRETRRRYDRTPLGRLFRDLAVHAVIWRRLVAQAAGDDRRLWEAAALLGLVPADRAQSLDQGSLEGEDGAAPPEQEIFPYGYYLWRAASAPPELLATWQARIVRAATEVGYVAQVAVGVVGRTPCPWVVARVGYLDVLFVHEDADPTEDMARQAVQRLITPCSA